MAIDKAINATVQKNLRKLKDDCEKVVSGIDEGVRNDKEKKKANSQNLIKVGTGVGLAWVGDSNICI